MAEIRAEDLRQLIRNFNPQMELEPNSSFYVEVDDARNSKGEASVRRKIEVRYKDMAEDIKSGEKLGFCRVLFCGHRASGKTTELRILQDVLKDDYMVVFLDKVDRQQDRFSDEVSFLYFVISEIVAAVSKNETLVNAGDLGIQDLCDYLEHTIFTEEKNIEEELLEDKTTASAGAEAGAEFSLFKLTAKLFGKVSTETAFDTQTKKVRETAMQRHFMAFVEIANNILMKINQKLLEEGKTLLVMIDGLDKVSDEIADRIFLNQQSSLTLLKCSMIVTFPVSLKYSPKARNAVDKYDGTYMLSMIKVHERDNSPCQEGVHAMKKIVECRMDTKTLLEAPKKNLERAIQMSGGNVRDLFGFFTYAATNARTCERDKIKTQDMELAYDSLRSDLRRSLTQEYLPVLRGVLEDTTKESVIMADSEDDILKKLFGADLLIEYNGKGWCDLHPLVREIVENLPDEGGL